MIDSATLRKCLDHSEATVEISIGLIQLADALRDDPYKIAALTADASEDVPLAALLQRNIRAAELFTGALRDLRTAIVTRGAPLAPIPFSEE